jgi:hypothetical protein
MSMITTKDATQVFYKELFTEVARGIDKWLRFVEANL